MLVGRQATADGALQLGASAPVIAQHVDVTAVRVDLVLFRSDELIHAEQHRVVLLLRKRDDAFARWDDVASVTFDHPARVENPIAGVAHFRANLDCPRREKILARTKVRLEPGNRGASLVEDGQLYRPSRTDRDVAILEPRHVDADVEEARPAAGRREMERIRE